MSRPAWTAFFFFVWLALYAAWTALRPMELSFERRIPSRLDPGSLWGQLARAFRDSTASPLWPNELETLRCDRLAPGELVRVVYHLPLGRDAALEYRITRYEEGRGLAYEALEGHPFRGGAEVDVGPSGGGSVLVWRGRYAAPGFSLAALYFRLFFERSFFEALERGIRRVESAPGP